MFTLFGAKTLQTSGIVSTKSKNNSSFSWFEVDFQAKGCNRFNDDVENAAIISDEDVAAMLCRVKQTISKKSRSAASTSTIPAAWQSHSSVCHGGDEGSKLMVPMMPSSLSFTLTHLRTYSYTALNTNVQTAHTCLAPIDVCNI